MAAVLLLLGQPVGLFFVLMGAAGTWSTLKYCEVTLIGHALQVSNYWARATIPLADITLIEERRWTKPRGAIILHFSRDFGLGWTAEFMPQGYVLNLFAEGELVTELKQLVKDTQAAIRKSDARL
jgi:hypothetical protein